VQVHNWQNVHKPQGGQKSAGNDRVNGQKAELFECKSLILDLDNTLFDWLQIWHHRFKAEFEIVLANEDWSRENLIKACRQIHQTFHTSEYRFRWQEIGISKETSRKLLLQNQIEMLVTSLYPGVLESLLKIQHKSTRIIAYTESQGEYVLERTRGHMFDVYGWHGFDATYCTKTAGFETSWQNTPHLKGAHWMPSHLKKPDPLALDYIVEHSSLDPATTLMVGDSLYKDIVMAKRAGIRCAHAAYGMKIDESAYRTLQAVSHWTDEDIAHDNVLRRQIASEDLVLKPDFSINSFPEIFDHCRFSAFVPLPALKPTISECCPPC